MTATPLLQVRDLSKTFGALKALDGINVAVGAGTLHGLIGPNGSGKSTLLKVIAGGYLPDSGTVSLEGRDITAARPYERARAGMSLKFQSPEVLPLLSVHDNVLLAGQVGQSPWRLLRSTSRRAMAADVAAALERFRLAERADDLAGELSHGEQQWLEIAMALAPKPKLLLVDEPTAGMSPEERRVTGKLLRSIKSECTLIIVEHDLDFIREICDQLTVIDQGRLLGTGTVEQIQRLPQVQEVYTARV